MRLHEHFAGAEVTPPWHPWAVGGGSVDQSAGQLMLALPDIGPGRYADAQITDYAGLRRSEFPWRPPLRLTVVAKASGPASALIGTAGFGFWNDPFVPGRREIPRLPRAVWFFFGGSRSNMALARGQPGNGWKAATFDAMSPLFFSLLPLAPPGFLLMRIPAFYRVLWPLGQRALGVAEASLPGQLLADRHEYRIDWLQDGVQFFVDGQSVLTADSSPRGPLGFISWIDNQYAVVTPQGRFGWGTVACSPQWLALSQVTIETL